MAGSAIAELENATARGDIVLAPLVIAELLSGATTPEQRVAIGELLQDYEMHQTNLGHWMRVGDLRRLLASNGVNATIPEAHIAQCALDRDAVVYTNDEIFVRIAQHTSLRVTRLR